MKIDRCACGTARNNAHTCAAQTGARPLPNTPPGLPGPTPGSTYAKPTRNAPIPAGSPGPRAAPIPVQADPPGHARFVAEGTASAFDQNQTGSTPAPDSPRLATPAFPILLPRGSGSALADGAFALNPRGARALLDTLVAQGAVRPTASLFSLPSDLGPGLEGGDGEERKDELEPLEPLEPLDLVEPLDLEPLEPEQP
jgi:hypothetical protein